MMQWDEMTNSLEDIVIHRQIIIKQRLEYILW